MGIPIIFGWGKKGKQVGYIGIDKCPNCRNYTHLFLYEYANNINIYFVPVAKFNKKLYLVCSTCDAAWELTEELKKEMLEVSITTLDVATTTYIWNEIIRFFDDNQEEYMKKYDINALTALYNDCIDKIAEDVGDRDYVSRVARKVLQSMGDDDTPS